MQRELMVLMATITPEEVLLHELQDALTDYKCIGGDELREKLCFHCQLFTLRTITNGDSSKMEELLNRIKQQEQREKLFKIDPS